MMELPPQLSPSLNDPVFFPGDALYLWGKAYSVWIEASHLLQKPMVHLGHDALNVVIPQGFNVLSCAEFVLAHLRKLAQDDFQLRIKAWSTRMQLSFHSQKTVHARTRWGSCSHKGSINLNWQLIRLPHSIGDYVIVHELAHLIHMNHGPHFWELVATFCPNHKMYRTLLKQVSLRWGYHFWQIRNYTS